MSETKILVADDDEQLLEMMVRRLKRNGLEADRAEDGNTAMRMIEHSSYDLLVTDLYMPGATGLALLRAAKERDPHIQVVVVTGSATMENAIEALNNGAFGYLNKPFDHVNVFDNMVARALEFRHLILDNQRMAEIQRKRGDMLEEEVTERVKQLRERQKEILGLLASLPDGILLVEEGGRVVLSSPVAEKWLAREMRTGGQPIQRFVETLYDEWADERLEVEIDSEYVLLQAFDLEPNDEKKRKVVIIHALDANPNGHLSDKMRDPLENLKNGLSWLYRRQMGSDVNQLLMDLANHISTLEQLVEDATKSNGHQTAELAKMEGIPPLESLMQDEAVEEELDLGGALDLDDGALEEFSAVLDLADSEAEEVDEDTKLEVGSEKPIVETQDTQTSLRRRLFQKKERWTDLLVKVQSHEEPEVSHEIDPMEGEPEVSHESDPIEGEPEDLHESDPIEGEPEDLHVSDPIEGEPEDSHESDPIESGLQDDEKLETFLDVLDEAIKDVPPDQDSFTDADEETAKLKSSDSQEDAKLKTGEWPPLPPSKTEEIDRSMFED